MGKDFTEFSIAVQEEWIIQSSGMMHVFTVGFSGLPLSAAAAAAVLSARLRLEQLPCTLR